MKINIIKNQKSKKAKNQRKQFLTLSHESETTNLLPLPLNSVNVIVRPTKKDLGRKRQLKKLQYSHNSVPKPALRVLKSWRLRLLNYSSVPAAFELNRPILTPSTTNLNLSTRIYANSSYTNSDSTKASGQSLLNRLWSKKTKTLNHAQLRYTSKSINQQNSSTMFQKNTNIDSTLSAYLGTMHQSKKTATKLNLVKFLVRLVTKSPSNYFGLDYIHSFREHTNSWFIAPTHFTNMNFVKTPKTPLKQLFGSITKQYNPNPTNLNLSSPTTFKVDLRPVASSIPWLHQLKLLLHILIENSFINMQKQSTLKPSKVLSKAPFYKLDDSSAITADRYRGNFYSRWGFSQLSTSRTTCDLTHSSSIYRLLRSTGLNKCVSPNTHWSSYLIRSKNLFRSYFHNSNLIPLSSTTNLFTRTILTRLPQITKQSLSKLRLLTLIGVRLNSRNFYKRSIYTDRRITNRSVHMKKIAKILFLIRRRGARKGQFINSLARNLSLGSKQYAFKNSNTWYASSSKKHAEYILNTLQWKLSKKLNIFTSVKRLNRKRRFYLSTFARVGLVPTRGVYFTHNQTKRTSLKNWHFQHNPFNKAQFFNQSTKSANILPFSSPQIVLSLISKPILLKQLIITSGTVTSSVVNVLSNALNKRFLLPYNLDTNLLPHTSFRKNLNKKVLNSFTNKSFDENLVPWYYHTLIRFMEHCSGKKVFFQFYPFMDQSVSAEHAARYKRWLPRMSFYERKLGHRFFLEEALHIMHLSFILRDPKILTSWLKAMILRISFWKTRSIFRFLKYLFNNYFRYVFADIGVKGLKIKLKGKISAAGNSRKRTILYRVGKTSHSETQVRVLSESTTVNTFTGVMGLNVWLFY